MHPAVALHGRVKNSLAACGGASSFLSLMLVTRRVWRFHHISALKGPDGKVGSRAGMLAGPSDGGKSPITGREPQRRRLRLRARSRRPTNTPPLPRLMVLSPGRLSNVPQSVCAGAGPHCFISDEWACAWPGGAA
jgi:hypothetical protein